MQTKKSNKELINCFKDYIDIADASYAMLHNVFENERNGLDELYDKFGKDNISENIVNSYREDEKKKPIWRYKDNIRKGDVLNSDIQDKDGNVVKKQAIPLLMLFVLKLDLWQIK